MGVNMLDHKCVWRYRDLVGRGWHFSLATQLILRPMSKPGGALPARYTHCCLFVRPCRARCGFGSLLWKEGKIELAWRLNLEIMLTKLFELAPRPLSWLQKQDFDPDGYPCDL
jgi:hypothetical protein